MTSSTNNFNKTRTESNIRVSYPELDDMINKPGLVSQETAVALFTGESTYILTGFDCSTATTNLTVELGKAFVMEQRGSSWYYGQLLSDNLTTPAPTQTVAFAALASGTYYIEVKFQYTAGNYADKKFWNEATQEEETRRVRTTYYSDWAVQASLTQTTGWTTVATQAWTAGAPGTFGTLTPKRNLFFEGQENGLASYTLPAFDQTHADRSQYGVTNLRDFCMAVLKKLEQMTGGTLKWYSVPTTSFYDLINSSIEFLGAITMQTTGCYIVSSEHELGCAALRLFNTTTPAMYSAAYAMYSASSVIKSYDGTDIRLIQNVGTVSKAADYPITAPESSGSTFINGASGAVSVVTFTLPSAAASMSATFACASSLTANPLVASSVLIYPASGDCLFVGNRIRPAVALMTIGDSITLKAIDSTYWMVSSIVSDWFYVRGYFCGSSAPVRDKIDYLQYKTETCAAVSAVLSEGKGAGAGVSGALAGYIMGGDTNPGWPSPSTVIEKLNYNNESCAAIVATLDTAKQDSAGVSGSLKGYCCGGLTMVPGATATAVIEYMKYSDDTSAAIVATLDTAKYACTGISGGAPSLAKGYVCGGATLPGPTAVNVIEYVKYSDETSVAIAATLDTAKYYSSGVSGSPERGYIMGGAIGGPAETNVIEYLQYGNETSAAISATLASSTGYLSSGVSGSVRGYIGSGATVDTINFIQYNNETSAALIATLTEAKQLVVGVSY